MSSELHMRNGDRVIKDGGDYTFEGEIVAMFRKRSGARRYVVEDDRGLLMIMSDAQIKPVRCAKAISLEAIEP